MLKHLHDKFASDEVDVDRSVHKSAQLARLPFTLNRKSEGTPERPHRMATIPHYPATFPEVIAGKVYHLGVEGGFKSEYDKPAKSTSSASELLIDECGIGQLIEEFPEVLTLSRTTTDGDLTYLALTERPCKGRRAFRLWRPASWEG